MTESSPKGAVRRFPTPKTVLDILATVTMTVAAVVVIWTQLRAERSPAARNSDVPLPSAPIAMDGLGVKGSVKATVGIIGFSDFQCPYCGRFAREVFPALDRDYIQTEKVRFLFRHLPLSFHPVALPAAIAAECAGEAGRFWELHDRLFGADPKSLTVDTVSTMAGASNVAASHLEACRTGAAAERVTRDVAIAGQLGVKSTPTFFVGRILPTGELDAVAAIPGALPIGEFTQHIDALLERPTLGTKLRALFSR